MKIRTMSATADGLKGKTSQILEIKENVVEKK